MSSSMAANQIGCFGDIVFEVSDKRILSLEGLKRETASKYENHELIGQKPRTEFIAPGLDTVTFTVHLKSQYGVNPREEMNKWLEYARSGTPAQLAIGGKFMGVDSWVVTNVSQHWDLIYSKGELVSGKIDVTLQEYVGARAYEENRRKEIEQIKAEMQVQKQQQQEAQNFDIVYINEISGVDSIILAQLSQLSEEFSYGSKWYKYSFAHPDDDDMDIYLPNVLGELKSDTIALVTNRNWRQGKRYIFNSEENFCEII